MFIMFLSFTYLHLYLFGLSDEKHGKTKNQNKKFDFSHPKVPFSL